MATTTYKRTEATEDKLARGYVYATVRMFGFNTWTSQQTEEIVEYTGWVKKDCFKDSQYADGESFIVWYIPKGHKHSQILTVKQRFISMELVA